jgi:hypothetical protein
MASAQHAKVDRLEKIATQSSNNLTNVMTQLSNISTNSNSSAELSKAALSCVMLHMEGVHMISDLGINEAVRQHAQLQLSVAAQSTGAT